MVRVLLSFRRIDSFTWVCLFFKEVTAGGMEGGMRNARLSAPLKKTAASTVKGDLKL